MDATALLDELRSSDALLEGHFVLSSGRHGERYFQCALALSDPARAARLARALAELPELSARPVDVVVGPALGAVVWAHEVARALGVRALFTERVDGTMQLRRGFRVARGERALVVEDVVTTGGSAREVIELLRGLGAEVQQVGAIVDRSSAPPLAELGVAVVSLARIAAASWAPADCPLCRAGRPTVQPGSRGLSAAPASSASSSGP